MRSIFLLIFTSFCFSFGFTQENKICELSFNTTYNNSPLRYDHNYYLKNGDSISFNSIKYYITSIELMDKGKSVWKEANSSHLIELNASLSLKIPHHVNFTDIKFSLGVDSTTNVAGVLGGDLDPTKGMYWTWQSGYINFKLEGKNKNCKSKKNEFQFHLGGYSFPNNSYTTTILKNSNTSSTVFKS